MKRMIQTLFFLSFAFALHAEQIKVEFFAQAGCEECRKIEAFVLPRLELECAGKYELIRYDIAEPESYLKLVAYQEKFHDKSNASSNVVLDGRILLTGYPQIDAELMKLVQNMPRAPASEISPDEAALEARAASFTISAVAAAGLIDGINPCVFATLVFFMSLLAVSRISGRKLLLVGSVYCLACFLTYFSLGFGLFRFLQLFSGYLVLRLILEYGMLALLLLFAFLSFRDAWKFKRSGDSRLITLQLPERVKKIIHTVMRRGLKYRYLIPGAFVTGLLVTVLESVCTGQVYIPTLVLMTREYGAGSRWFGLLLLYNLMFIVPLLILFFAAWRGVSTSRFLAWSKANVVYSKISLGLFFLALAGFFLFMTGGRV